MQKTRFQIEHSKYFAKKDAKSPLKMGFSN
jgi:hypothetical protein